MTSSTQVTESRDLLGRSRAPYLVGGWSCPDACTLRTYPTKRMSCSCTLGGGTEKERAARKIAPPRRGKQRPSPPRCDRWASAPIAQWLVPVLFPSFRADGNRFPRVHAFAGSLWLLYTYAILPHL
jgi:hypothetical protein